MAGDRQFLEQHGNQWRVIVKVPVKARKVLGCTHLKRGLKTFSLAEANRLKWDVVADLKRQIGDALVSSGGTAATSTDPLAIEAMAWRRQIEDQKHDPSFDPEQMVPLSELLVDRAYEIEVRDGFGSARTFNAVASGVETPIKTLVDTWLVEAKVTPRSIADYRRAVDRFVAWCSASKIPQTIEAVGRRTAGRFVSQAFIATKTYPKTTNKYISALSSYWRWLVKRGHCEENPWINQSVSKAKPNVSGIDIDKRPFNDAEVRALMSAKPLEGAKVAATRNKRADVWDALPDVLRIAALSGMRIDEIARLTVGDCVDDIFDIRKSKTAAGRRKVPIHSGLKQLVARRTAGKGASASLIHELKEPKPGSLLEKSMPLVKAFVVYRRGLGVDDQPDGARQSRVDFHSFRRWFITKAEMAGQPPHIISSVVGHEVGRQGMTLGVYSGGPSIEQMRECVAAVIMPEGV